MQWAQFYEQESPSRGLIVNMMETYFLLNVVHNDFTATDAIFEEFLGFALPKSHAGTAATSSADDTVESP